MISIKNTKIAMSEWDWVSRSTAIKVARDITPLLNTEGTSYWLSRNSFYPTEWRDNQLGVTGPCNFFFFSFSSSCCFVTPFLAPRIVQEPIAMLPADSRLEMTLTILLYFILFVCFVFHFLTPRVIQERIVLPEDHCSRSVG